MHCVHGAQYKCECAAIIRRAERGCAHAFLNGRAVSVATSTCASGPDAFCTSSTPLYTILSMPTAVPADWCVKLACACVYGVHGCSLANSYYVASASNSDLPAHDGR